METCPGTALEVVKAEFFLELLMRLLPDRYRPIERRASAALLLRKLIELAINVPDYADPRTCLLGYSGAMPK
jgi:hypothetical protein